MVGTRFTLTERALTLFVDGIKKNIGKQPEITLIYAFKPFELIKILMHIFLDTQRNSE